MALLVLSGGCARLADLGNGSANPAPSGADGAPAPRPTGQISSPAGLELVNEAATAPCDNKQFSCAVLLRVGALPRVQLSYRVEPGDSWSGSIERQQRCVDTSGASHGEAVRAWVTARLTAADATGNLTMEVNVTDVVVSDPSADPTQVAEFPLGATTRALFSNRGLAIEPRHPPIYAAALITPLAPVAVGIGGRWEIRSPSQGLRDVRQLELFANDGSGVAIEAVTGTWLDETRSAHEITESSTTLTHLDTLGPIHRRLEMAQGAGCFVGTATGPVLYLIAADPPEITG